MVRQAELADLVAPAEDEGMAGLQHICVALPHVLYLVADRVCTQVRLRQAPDCCCTCTWHVEHDFHGGC